MRVPRLTLAVVAAGLLALPALAEDLTVVFKTTSQEKASTSTNYYSAERMRTTDGTSDMIVEYGPGRIVTIDHARKEYSEITMAEMEAAFERMAAQMSALPQGMPPAMRRMMGGGAETVSVTKGAMRKVAGYDCQEYVLVLGKASTMNVCASTAVAPPPAKVDYRKYSSLAGMANSPMFKSHAKLADEMKKIEGFTLAESSSIKMMGQTFHGSREATEVKQGPIAAAVFDVAALTRGYRKVPHPLAQTE